MLVPVQLSEGTVRSLDYKKMLESSYFATILREIEMGIKELPIPLAISIYSKETFELVAEYFTRGQYPPEPPRRSLRTGKRVREELHLVPHAEVFDAASQLGMPRLQEMAMGVFADPLSICEHEMKEYVNSLKIIYKPGFGSSESKPSTAGPPRPDTMKWIATHGFMEYLPVLYFRNAQSGPLREFCWFNGEYCYDMMAAILESGRVNGNPVTSLIRHQMKTSDFKILCCNDMSFAFGTFESLMKVLPCRYSGTTFDFQHY